MGSGRTIAAETGILSPMPASDPRARASAAVFEAILKLEGATIPELIKATGRSETTVQQVLQRFEELGLVWLEDGPPVIYHRVSRASGLASLAARRRGELDRMRSDLELEFGMLDVLFSAAEVKPGWNPRVEQVEDLAGIRTRLAELQRKSSKELLSFDYGQGGRAAKAARQRAYEVSAQLDREWLARGGSMRTICAEAVQRDGLAWAFIRRPISEAGLIRMSPTLPMQMLIIDRETAVLPVDRSDSTPGALFIREPGIVSALVDLFESYWIQAKDVDSFLSADSSGLTGQHRMVLGLLALGHKDESIARNLGVSLRTASRIISETLDLLGAESRFQAGVLASRRGWL